MCVNLFLEFLRPTHYSFLYFLNMLLFSPSQQQQAPQLSVSQYEAPGDLFVNPVLEESHNMQDPSGASGVKGDPISRSGQGTQSHSPPHRYDAECGRGETVTRRRTHRQWRRR